MGPCGSFFPSPFFFNLPLQSTLPSEQFGAARLGAAGRAAAAAPLAPSISPLAGTERVGRELPDGMKLEAGLFVSLGVRLPLRVAEAEGEAAEEDVAVPLALPVMLRDGLLDVEELGVRR